MAKTGWGKLFMVTAGFAALPVAVGKGLIDKATGQRDFSDSVEDVMETATDAAGGFGDRHHDQIADGAFKAVGALAVTAAAAIGKDAIADTIKKTLK